MSEFVDRGGETERNTRSERPPEFPRANVVAVDAIASVLRPTLGPLARDKLLVKTLEARSDPDRRDAPAVDEFTVASDGARVLEALSLEHPVAPIVRRIVGPERPGETDVEGERIPDGITTTVVLTAALLREAESLIERGLHPREVLSGYHEGLSVALETIDRLSRPLAAVSGERDATRAVARTAMTGNDVGGQASRWAKIAVEAVDLVGAPDEATLPVRTLRRGRVADSRLVRGAVLDRSERASQEMPRTVRDAAVLVLEGQDEFGLQAREPRVDHDVQIEDPASLPAADGATRERRRRVVDHLAEVGVDVVVAQSGIDPTYQRLLADRGILGIRGVTSLDLRTVTLATGATPVVRPLDATTGDLGDAGTVEERRAEKRRHRSKVRRMVVFEDCDDPASVTVLLRGVSGQLAEQATTQLRTAAAAVARARGEGGSEPGVVPGSGAVHVRVSRRVADVAPTVEDRSQLAVEGFADAALAPVRALVRNAGHDPVAVLGDLTAAHAEGRTEVGFLLPRGTTGDAVANGVLDPASVVRRGYVAATEVTDLLLPIDDAIDAVRRPDVPDPGDAIYEAPAERQVDHLESRTDSGRRR